MVWSFKIAPRAPNLADNTDAQAASPRCSLGAGYRRDAAGSESVIVAGPATSSSSSIGEQIWATGLKTITMGGIVRDAGLTIDQFRELLWPAGPEFWQPHLEEPHLQERSIRVLPGQYYDAETGTNYNYFRDYDPTVGRYEQSDPRGLRSGVNTYCGPQ